MKEHENSKINHNSLDYLSAVSWDEVKAVWKGDEDTDAFRREYAEQGYESWESWRDLVIRPLQLDTLTWNSYSVIDPSAMIPRFRGGPFKPWEDQYYGGKITPTFAEIVTTEGTDVAHRDKFKDIINANNPATLIGIMLKHEIFIIEGMHRATAIALSVSRGNTWNAPVQLLLADSDIDQLDTID